MEVSGRLHAPAALPPGKEPPVTHLIGSWEGRRAGLDTVVKRKLPIPCRDSNPQIIQPVAHRYITELSRLGVNKEKRKNISQNSQPLGCASETGAINRSVSFSV
jgi:hypothetical protein